MTDQVVTEVDTTPACKVTDQSLIEEDTKPACKVTDQGLSEEDIKAACKEGNPITKDYMMQQTMLRVKDPVKSLDFYTRILGLTLLQKIDFPSMHFTLYYLGYEDKKEVPQEVKERTAWTFSRRATIELTHNWGSEADERLLYHHGNTQPTGFGHIGIAVPDVYAACKLFEELGVTFVKKPDEGTMKGLAFIQDPDGYWIEILSPNNMVSLTSETERPSSTQSETSDTA
ncbi:hypothetical protein AOLI_G00035830 [Acnodon oligacanthus]